MYPHLDPNIQKALHGGIASVITWVTGQAVQSVDSIPDVLKAADTPLILGFGAFVILHLWKAWQKERSLREEDTRKFIEHLQTEAEKSAESRSAVVLAVERQTVASESTAQEIKALKHAIETSRQPLYQNKDPR